MDRLLRSPAPVLAAHRVVTEREFERMSPHFPENSRTIVVSFSGIDGAGKSTQIDDLRADLTGAGYRVAILAFWDDVASLKGLRQYLSRAVFHGDPGVGTPTQPVNRRDKNVQAWPMTLFRFFLYFMDALSLRRTLARVRRATHDVVIFDRYLYDELANLNLNASTTRAYVRLLLKMTPHPDLACILDVNPAQARARKPEYPLDFLQTNRGSYLTLSRIVGRITVVPPGPRHEVHSLIQEAVLRLLRNQSQIPAPQMNQHGVTEV